LLKNNTLPLPVNIFTYWLFLPIILLYNLLL
jgi:hypothetical protein